MVSVKKYLQYLVLTEPICSFHQQVIRSSLAVFDFSKVASQLIEIALRYGRSPVNLLHIFRTTFPKNTLGGCFWSDGDVYLDIRIAHD